MLQKTREAVWMPTSHMVMQGKKLGVSEGIAQREARHCMLKKSETSLKVEGRGTVKALLS